MLGSGPAYASCEWYPLEKQIKKSDIVFEGRLTRYEGYPTEDAKQKYLQIVKNYVVERTWKGVKVGEHIRVMFPGGLQSMDDIPQEARISQTRIFALEVPFRWKLALGLDKADLFFGPCPQSYDPTAKNKNILDREFPAASP